MLLLVHESTRIRARDSSLPLRDALAYSEVSTITFDAVCYVFAHRKLLDFSSPLDVNTTISMPDAAILIILHAHTRASVITNLFTTYI